MAAGASNARRTRYHCVTGFLADGADQWRAAMESLLAESALADAMSARILEQYPRRVLRNTQPRATARRDVALNGTH